MKTALYGPLPQFRLLFASQLRGHVVARALLRACARLDCRQAALEIGALILVSGICGTLAASACVGRLFAAGRTDARLRFFQDAALVQAGTICGAMLTPTRSQHPEDAVQRPMIIDARHAPWRVGQQRLDSRHSKSVRSYRPMPNESQSPCSWKSRSSRLASPMLPSLERPLTRAYGWERTSAPNAIRALLPAP